MNPSYRQLKAFLAAARFRNFTKASQQMHITQAGLSAMIKELEAQVGCRLLYRTTRLVDLTPEGQAFLPSAEAAVAAIDAALEAWPVDPAITATLEPDPVLDGLWFTVALGSLQRRQLFTPAGLGHCRAEVS